MNIKKYGALLSLVLALGMTSVSTTPAMARHHHWGAWGGYGPYGYGRWGGGLGSFVTGAAVGSLVGNALGNGRYGDYYSPSLYSGYSTYVPSSYSGATIVPSTMYGAGTCGLQYNGCNVCPY